MREKEMEKEKDMKGGNIDEYSLKKCDLQINEVVNRDRNVENDFNTLFEDICTIL